MESLDSTQAESQTIYAAAQHCSSLFKNHLGAPETSEERKDVAKELYGQFNLWVAYVGAFASPKASLDARLADHNDIAIMVHELLAMIERNIKYGRFKTIYPS